MKRMFATGLLGVIVSVSAAHAECPPEKKAKLLAVNARIVGVNRIEQTWLVIDPGKGDGEITDITSDESKIPPDAVRLVYDGYAFPGLIDTHNHVQFNSIPQWKPEIRFANRYQWNNPKNRNGLNDDYFFSVANVYRDEIEPSIDLMTTSVLYAEIRAVIGGTTMIQSSYYSTPPTLPIRNLRSTDTYKVANSSANILEIKPKDLTDNASSLRSKKLHRYFLHIAEGRSDDQGSKDEFGVLKANNLLTPGMVIIHGTALGKPEFKEMAENGVYLSWSPRSNINLYNQTTDIPSAIESGVTVALSPDWTISGSNNLLEEMKFAFNYAREKWGNDNPLTPERLFKMVTVDAALVAGIEGKHGKLEKGFNGDFLLAPRLDENPYVSLLKTSPKDINLVVVGGRPVYGDETQMGALYKGDAEFEKKLDPIVVEDRKKLLLISDENTGNEQRFVDVKWLLRRCLPQVAPLIETH